MDFAWNLVYDLLEERGLLGERFVRRGVHRDPVLGADNPKGFFNIPG